MTLNVRQPDQDNGPHAWEFRRDALVDAVLEAGPDLIGAQELFTLRAEYIGARAPEYCWFGTGRFGDTRDKHVSIFYRKDRLRLLERGDFWLSETPDAPGTSSWGIIRPRQVTGSRFETVDGRRFHHFNTHLPYRKAEEEARRQTACLPISRTRALNPVLITTGDFNAPAGGEIHSMLAADFEDAWLTAERRYGPEGTIHGFGKHARSRRIDWILYRAPWRPLEAATLSGARDGIYPSDHSPVMALFELDK